MLKHLPGTWLSIVKKEHLVDFTIRPIPALTDNYIWMINRPDEPYAVIVDPGDAQPVLKALDHYQLRLCAILITHHHYDHCAGIGKLLEHFTVPVFGPAKESVKGVTHSLKGNDKIECPHINLAFHILDIPGHTKGHIAYYAQNMVFSGDTLFTGGCGRLFEGTDEQLCNSLQSLANLPDDTFVYCGHEYTEGNLQFASLVEPNNQNLKQRLKNVEELRAKNLPTVPATLASEKQTNPFFRYENPEIIQAIEHYAGNKLKSSLEIFSGLRRWKESYFS